MRLMPILALAAAAAVSGPAAAQQKPNLNDRAQLSASLETNFKAFDLDGNGSFDKAEYLRAQTKVREQEWANLQKRLELEFADLDGNRDKMLTAAEIGAKVKSSAKGTATVQRIDKDGNGKVTLAEYKGQFKGLAPVEDADSQMKRWDGDGNGTVVKQEFVGPPLARFDAFDTDKNGILSTAEAKSARTAALTGSR